MAKKTAVALPADDNRALTQAAGLRGEINALHREALKSGNEMLRNAVQCGERLEQVKLVLKACKTTSFGKWIEQNLDFSERSAQSYCKLYNDLGKLPKAQSVALLGNADSINEAKRLIAEVVKPERKASSSPVTVEAESVTQTEGYMNVIRGTDGPDEDHEPTDDEIRAANGENLDAEPPPPDEAPAKKVKSGAEKVSAAKLVDETIRTLVSPLARAILGVAKVNGGKGEQYQLAIDHLNEVIACLKEMRKGNQ